MFVIVSRFDAIGFRRDNRRGFHCRDHFQKAVGIKSLIGHHRAHVLHPFDKIRRFGDVVLLPAGQTKSGQIAQPIDNCMNLGTQAPTRTAKTLLPVFLGAPAACWWARTIVLSRKTSSKSASSQSLAKMACQTPLSAQREKRLNTEFHGPNPGWRSRQGEPVLAIHKTASTNRRLSAPVRPRSPALPWSIGAIRNHWSSRNNNLGILSSTQKTGCKHNYAFVNSTLDTNVHAL